MANDAGALPPAMFDPRTLASALEQGKVLPSCKQAITTATDYLHDRFRGGGGRKATVLPTHAPADALGRAGSR